MSGNSYGTTTGTSSRGGRPLMERLMTFSLADEIQRLREEPAWAASDRNSRTLAKEIDFRLLLSVLRDGAALDEEGGGARMSVQVLEGRATLQLEQEQVALAAGDLAVVDSGQSWTVRAVGEAALLLTLAWPRDSAATI